MAAAKGENTSPTNSGILPAVEWRRPSEFLGTEVQPRIFEGRIEPSDIVQGQLGDCWLLCALASVANHEQLIKELVPESECNPAMGLYVTRLCKDGEWKKVLLDSYIPCTPKAGPIYAKAGKGELWVSLLEKAFAKYNGSYAAIRSGWIHEALIDLTGAPFKEFCLDDGSCEKIILDGSLWDRMKRYSSLNYIMAVSTPGVDHITEGGGTRRGGGLVPGHAYSLLKVQESKDGKHKLCKVRNPWGQYEWTGDWSDKSPLWTEAYKEEFGLCDSDNGIFWMPFDLLVADFHAIVVSMVRRPSLNTVSWKEERKKLTYKFSHEAHGVESVQMYKLIIAGNGAELYATVHQQDKRKIGSPLYFDIGVTILKETSIKGEYKFIGSSGNAVDRQHQLEVPTGSLPQGTYILVATSTGCKIENERRNIIASGKSLTPADVTRSAVISVHCDQLVLMQEIAFDPVTYEQAIKMPIMAKGEQTDLFGDGSVILYTLKSGYNGNSYVAENKKTDEYAKLEMDFSNSTNIVTEDGDLNASLVIGPGQSRIIHHVMPADDHLSWNCKWSVKGALLTEEQFKAAQI